MRVITLSKSDFSLLEKINTAEQIGDFNPMLKDGQIILRGTEKQLEMLIDIVSDELTARGFSSTFEPTEYGRALEGIIDTLYNSYQ